MLVATGGDEGQQRPNTVEGLIAHTLALFLVHPLWRLAISRAQRGSATDVDEETAFPSTGCFNIRKVSLLNDAHLIYSCDILRLGWGGATERSFHMHTVGLIK